MEFTGASVMGFTQLPALAKLARDKVLEEYEKDDKAAAKMGNSLSYFDDLGQGLTWTESSNLTPNQRKEKLIQRAAKTETIFTAHSLPFKGWESQFSGFDEQVKATMESPDRVIEMDKLETHSIQEASHLGLSFHLGRDTLGMKKRSLNLGRKTRGDRSILDALKSEEEVDDWLNSRDIRKRDLLGFSRAVFDPIGLVPGLTASLKLKYAKYLQDYPDHGWNTVVAKDVVSSFSTLLKSVIKMKREVEVPRYVGKPLGQEDITSTLIAVIDGKMGKGSCSMVYLHHEWNTESETEFTCNLLASRNKLLPSNIVDQVRAEVMALATGTPLVMNILSILEGYEEFKGIEKILALDSQTTCLLLTQEPSHFKSSISSVLNHAQGLWSIDEIYYLEGKNMDLLADIGTKEWNFPEDSWRHNDNDLEHESYFTGAVFNRPRNEWPIIGVTTFMNQERKLLHKLPFLRENLIRVTNSSLNYTVSLWETSRLEEEVPAPGAFWYHLQAYQNLNKTVNALVEAKRSIGRRWRRKDAEQMVDLVAIREDILHLLLQQEQEWSRLSASKWPPSRLDYRVETIRGILCVIGRGLEQEPSEADGTFRLDLPHPTDEIGFVAPILHPDSLFTKSLLNYKHHQLGHGKSPALLRDRVSLSWYIPGSLKICERIKKTCPRCRFNRPRPLTSDLGRLPAFRINPTNENKTLVVDIIGPIHLIERPGARMTRGSQKYKTWELIAVVSSLSLHDGSE